MGGSKTTLVLQQRAARQGPATDLGRANTLRVVNQALRWRGLTAVETNAGWRDEDCDPEQARGRRCSRVRGNWGVPGDPDCPPCWPHFNSCRLTTDGERVARRLLEHQPEYCK